ncbi:MAG: bifunctional demethylmenaquinone methyltransferase/2-methoxy-6-polyprenyl-1,4-benzoquinol methylase UbiE [Muribaculaceae bacterium]|nr:bifunctional demethylmenaquinone methyltransferase/2-methoxy-6-polyprenyl-1,4-benzoquinol methylase UbiE [Muribaculaceae bacterium]
MKVEEISPYGEREEKGEEVEQMFDSISRRYDMMNAAMSLGQHKRWRNIALKAAIRSLPQKDNLKILDVATGTGDVAFKLHKLFPEALITGIDLSDGMLDIAREKLNSLPAGEQKFLAFGKGDSLGMPFHQGEFNFITVAYGVRNFSDLRKGIDEMRRVLAPGGVLCIIELSTPRSFLTRTAYDLYAGKLIPIIGKWVSGDKRAYSYLPESIAACPKREDMAALLYASGFSHVEWKSLSFGALTYYVAR